MTSLTPAFLLIMPSYNQAHYIASAVESVLSQDDQNWVLWVIDNSNDNTPDVMKGYSDPRIHFVHIPQRMDPGSCLNWVLEREGTKHRDFSYLHTDNILRSDHVRQMRQALAGPTNVLAYCDMRCIDANGVLTGVFRRGEFDLARLFSLSPLGVPFSATTRLADELGAFSRQDVADDVVFCIRAWPHARFVHVPDAIMDYRLHGNSRTEAHGGAWEINRSFLLTYHRLLPELLKHGCDPVEALLSRINRLQTDVHMQLEDIWYREREFTSLVPRSPSLQTWFDLDLIDLPNLTELVATTPDRKEKGWSRLWGKLQKRLRRWQRQLALGDESQHIDLKSRIHRQCAWETSIKLCDHAVPWLYLSIRQLGSDGQHLRLASTDIHTLWITRVLNRICGWRFNIDSTQDVNLDLWPHLDVTPPPSNGVEALISLAPGDVWVRPSGAH